MFRVLWLLFLFVFCAEESRADYVIPGDTKPAWLTNTPQPPVFLSPSDVGNNPAAPQPPVPAASKAAYVPATVPNYIEAGVNFYDVTNNYGNSFGQFVNVQYQTDPWNRWSGGIQHAQAFHDSGESVSLGNTHVFDEDWYSDLGGSVASSATFLPRYRVDASLSRKWLDNRNFITTLGVTYDAADETYVDHTLHFGVAYYFTSPWVIQAGVNINDSTPGNVIAPSAFWAATYGYEKRYFLTGRYIIAREAYQILHSGNINNSFTSHTLGGNWRQWVGADWGFNLGGEFYTNPYYDRTGVIVSVFKEF